MRHSRSTSGFESSFSMSSGAIPSSRSAIARNARPEIRHDPIDINPQPEHSSRGRGLWTRIAAATPASMPFAGRVSPVSKTDWTATATSEAEAPSRIQYNGLSTFRNARTAAAASAPSAVSAGIASSSPPSAASWR